ncbi:MAG: DivIVA domain-containing protein [Chitinispirillales bacterium]|jgi:cell division initiation protein|nr:DivIVA domain-containing protein [Chitinispirillales bacterium]
MRITPLDIRKQPFKQTLRGYDPYAVRAFLEELAKQDEELIRQNNEFATEIKGLRQELEKYKNIERMLNETLMTAQRLSDDARASAQTEAKQIIAAAQINADRLEIESRHTVNQLSGEIISIRNQRDSFLARFKTMLTTQLNLLEVISGDLRNDDLPKQEEQQPEPPRFAPPKIQPTIGGGSGSDNIVDDDTIDDVPPPVILA